MNGEGLEHHLMIVRDWIEDGHSPYTEEGTVIFLRSLLKRVEPLASRLDKIREAIDTYAEGDGGTPTDTLNRINRELAT